MLTPINQGIRIFDQFRFTGGNRYLFTMDVKPLHNVIPNADVISALEHFLEQRTIKIQLPLLCFALLNWYLPRIVSLLINSFMSRLVVLLWVINLVQAMLAYLLATKNT